MKKKYQMPKVQIISLHTPENLLAGSDEKGVVHAGQGKGETSDGDSYITLGKQHNAWNTWDEEEQKYYLNDLHKKRRGFYD